MTQTVGLIGWPVEHSRSPAMHNAAFAALGLDWQYVLLPTPTEQLERVLGRLRSGELSGANVTIPHKSTVLLLLDEIDSAARSIGAVNSIVMRRGQLVGYNTDAVGFARALSQTGVEVKNKPCAVLGAGGSARAVVYALSQLDAHVTVYARDLSKARAVYNTVRLLSKLGTVDRETALIVNTTPVGMWPQVNASPWPDGVDFPPNAFAFDLIYNPLHTRWMSQAEHAGLRTTNGLAMLVHQGAAAFEMWTGCTPPVDVMLAAIS